mmetsp:Transcript_19475/g.51534  ORF Transcript_19475/g.51534 Transcript_19475/m.51534 type:complete len:773 (-) Transcript_19475:163-2481(-)
MAEEYSSVARDPSLAPKVREAAMLLSAAEQHLVNEDGEEAMQTAQSSLAIFREVKEPAGVADALRTLVGAHTKMLEHDEALRVASDELAKFRAVGERRGEAVMLLSVAEASVRNERRSKALEPALQALAIFQELKDRKMEARALQSLANIRVERAHRGNLELEAGEALLVGESAVRAFRELGDKSGEAKTHHAMSLAHLCLGSPDAALKSGKASLALWEELGEKRQQALELTSIAALNVEAKNKKAAMESSQQAIAILDELADKPMQVPAYVAQVKACTAEEDYAKAIELAEDGSAKFEKTRDTAEAAGVLESLVEAYAAKPDNAEAIATADRLFVMLKDARRLTSAHKRLEARVHHTVGRVHMAEERFQEADKALSEAVKIADELGDNDEKAQYLITLSNAKVGLKDHTEGYATGHMARDLLRRSRNRRAEGTAFLNLCSMHAAKGDLRKAVTMGKEAQILFARMGHKRGEVDAIFMLVQILIAGSSQELAVKLSKRGQELLQELGNETDEFSMLGLCGRARFLAACNQGGCWQEGKTITPMWDKVLETCKELQSLAKRIGDDEMMAHAWFISGQTCIMRGDWDIAQQHLDQALKVTVKRGDERAEAHLHLTVAQLRIMQQKNDEAKALLEKTKETFERNEDKDGANLSQELLDFLAGVPSKPPPKPQAEVPAGGDSITAVAVYEGPTEEQVIVAVTDVALSLIGVDGLDGDTPLMDAGLDSLASVEFQNTLQKEFQGVQLPSTLIFDFPNVKQISEFIHTGLVEGSGGGD